MKERCKISLCNDWEFVSEWSEEFLRGEGGAESVRLPHTVLEQPLHYALPSQYERICGYRRTVRLPEEAAGPAAQETASRQKSAKAAPPAARHPVKKPG